MTLCREFKAPLRVHADIDDPRSSPFALLPLALAYPDVPVILAHMPGEYTLYGLRNRRGRPHGAQSLL